MGKIRKKRGQYTATFFTFWDMSLVGWLKKNIVWGEGGSLRLYSNG